MSKSRIFDRAIFNSYVKLPEGNVNPGLINPAVELGGYHKKKYQIMTIGGVPPN